MLNEYQSQCHSLIWVKGHSDFKVKCLTFGLYTQVSDSGPQGPLVNQVFKWKNGHETDEFQRAAIWANRHQHFLLRP